MNDKIKKLIEKAGGEVKIYGGAKIHINKDQLDVEKLAELVVKECGKFIVKTYDFGGDEVYMSDALKEHFGVE